MDSSNIVIPSGDETLHHEHVLPRRRRHVCDTACSFAAPRPLGQHYLGSTEPLEDPSLTRDLANGTINRLSDEISRRKNIHEISQTPDTKQAMSRTISAIAAYTPQDTEMAACWRCGPLSRSHRRTHFPHVSRREARASMPVADLEPTGRLEQDCHLRLFLMEDVPCLWRPDR